MNTKISRGKEDAAKEKPVEGKKEDVKKKDVKKEDVKRKDKVKTKPFKKQLPVKLTSKELYSFARELAQETAALMENELKKGEEAARFGAIGKKHKLTIGVLSRLISTEEEYREIDCHFAIDFKTDKKELVRKDTGQIIETTKVTDVDRQMDFKLK